MTLLERRARWIYEAARLEAIASERPIVPEPLDAREPEFQAQFAATIERICVPGYITTPEAEHNSWMRAYKAMGWRYGPTRSVLAKTHPDMMPFEDLPRAERDKDAVFLALCKFAMENIR